MQRRPKATQDGSSPSSCAISCPVTSYHIPTLRDRGRLLAHIPVPLKYPEQWMDKSRPSKLVVRWQDDEGRDLMVTARADGQAPCLCHGYVTQIGGP